MSGHKSGVPARISKIAYLCEGNISCSPKYSCIGNSQRGDPIKCKTVATILHAIRCFTHSSQALN